MKRIKGRRPNKNRQIQPLTNRGGTLTGTWNTIDMAVPHFGNVAVTDNRVYNFVQMKNLTTVITGSNSVPTFLGQSFNVNAHVNQWSSFANIFDQYRVACIEAWLIPGMSGTTTTNTGTQSLYSVTDYDDANTPSSNDNLLQFTNVIVSPSTNGHYRKWVPHIAEAAYSGAFSSFANKTAPWIDVASSSVQHYGLKAGLDAGATVSVQLYVRMHLQFRNVF